MASPPARAAVSASPPVAAAPAVQRAESEGADLNQLFRTRETLPPRFQEPRAIQQAALSGTAGPGAPLPYLSTLQRAFGDHDLGQVRAHSDDRAAFAAASIGADAYTVGNQIAFASPNPSLHLVAHETTHFLQQRSGVQLKGGVGEAGDPYEQQAERVADAVVRGESVQGLLQPLGGAGGSGVSAPSVQRNSVDAQTKKAILARIKARQGTSEHVTLSDEFYGFDQDRGLAAIGVASMADDFAFETVAQAFEARLGALAYRHPNARKVCQAAGDRALAYVNRKHATAVNQAEAYEDELLKMGIDKKEWSGAVGKSAEAIESILKSGSVNEQVAHIENFVLNILNADMLANAPGWRDFAKASGFKMKELAAASTRLKGTNDRYMAYSVPRGEASAEQWHSRIGVKNLKKDKLPFHPSTFPKRPKAQLESQPPIGLQTTLGDKESAFQKQQLGNSQELGWEEGARIWVLNELDSWVAAQRALSLPLAGGMSSTTARIMQAFAFLNVGPPDDVRLAAIGALLPPRHHSLVEVMHAARPFGTSPYREGAMMYRDVKPLTEKEIAESIGDYPDVLVDPRGRRGGRSVHYKPLMEGGPQSGPEPPRANPQVNAPLAFTMTRRTLSQSGISVWVQGGNNPEARMLRAVDRYHLLKTASPLMALHALAVVRKEADLWLANTGRFTNARRINAFRSVRAAAAQVIDTYQTDYLNDLQGGNMLAGSANATQAISDVGLAHQNVNQREPDRFSSNQDEKAFYRDQQINKYGLTEAEVAALGTYVGPAYQYINPSLESDPGRVGKRLRGFLKETKSLESDSNAETARAKLAASSDPTERAMEESSRHATLITMALDKLPVFNGQVYAGGACTRAEAMTRFQSGVKQYRGAFASSSWDQTIAEKFADEKYEKLQTAFERGGRRPGTEPFAYVLTWRSKSGRKIEAFAKLYEEKEVLFPPGSMIRITSGADVVQPTEGRFGTPFHLIEVEEL